MKKIVLVMLLGVAVAGYGQFYEPEHLWHRSGGEGHSYFGYYAAGIGDVNEDGYDDFLAFDRLGDSTWVDLFFGGNPPDTIPAMVFHNPYPYGTFGSEIENVGDVNGDGWDDFAISGYYSEDNRSIVFIYYGGNVLDTIPDVMLTEGVADDAFGATIQGIGDVNSDGCDDLAVFAFNYGNCRGKTWVYFGGEPMDSIADWEHEGSGQLALFGKSIAGKGDLNGDGYDDFVVSEYLHYPSPDSVIFHIYYGRTQLDTIPDLNIQAWDYVPQFYIYTPSAIIANLNGDAYSDLVIVTANTPFAVVFYGGNPIDTTIGLNLGGFPSPPPAYGTNIACAGDVNDDGWDDVVLAQEDAYERGGLVLVYLGSPWMSGQPDMYWVGTMTPYDGAGVSLVDCGDINGDGVDDIMFGSYVDPWNTPGALDIWKGSRSFVVHVPEASQVPIPINFRLLPPYPNPFNSNVTIPFEIQTGPVQDVRLRIYNVLGQQVRDLTHQIQAELLGNTSGRHEVIWNGKDQAGNDLGSGIYVVELRDGTKRQVQKMVLLR